MEHQSIRTSQDQSILSAWREGVAEASRSPELLREVNGRERALFPHFAEHYKTLRALPRRVRRAMQRKWKHSLAGVALCMALGGGPAMAGVINVNVPGTGGCTLINAINSATQDSSIGGCAAGSGADTIVLPANSMVTLTAVNNGNGYGPYGGVHIFNGPNGLPLITSNITIQGNGSTITRVDGSPDFRIFCVYENGHNAHLTLQNTTISGGRLRSVTDGSDSDGAGLANYGGIVSLIDSTVTGNAIAHPVTNNFCTFQGCPASGGGVYNDRNGTMTLTRSTVSNNYAWFDGGGVKNLGTIELIDSTVSGNIAPRGLGGGLHNRSNNMTVRNSTITGNTAGGGGGGAYNYGGDLTVSSSTVSGNSGGLGGGLANLSGPMTVTDSTITGNSATYVGGVSNSYGTITFSRSIVSGNTSPNPAGFLYYFNGTEVNNLGGTVIADKSNLFGHSGQTIDAAFRDFTPGATDIDANSDSNTPAALAAILDTTLADNGGPTRTHALVSGSPAIDAVVGTCPTTDQRGLPRPVGNACDIGAFELQQVSNHPPVAQCHNVTASTVINTCAVPSASINNGSSDPDNGDSITLSQSPAGPYPLGPTAVTLTVTDNHGAFSSCQSTVTVADGQPPAITCPGDQTATASAGGTAVNFSVNASDNCGTVITSCSPASGSTFPIGTTPVTCTATDGASSQTNCGFNVQVRYPFTGFFQPVDNLPIFNQVKAGQGIQMKFSLGGNFGLGIVAADAPGSQPVACDSGAPVDDLGEETTSPSGLTYDATTNQYKYTWKTQKTWANTCRQFVLKLIDGTTHLANFKFKK